MLAVLAWETNPVRHNNLDWSRRSATHTLVSHVSSICFSLTDTPQIELFGDDQLQTDRRDLYRVYIRLVTRIREAATTSPPVFVASVKNRFAIERVAEPDRVLSDVQFDHTDQSYTVNFEWGFPHEPVIEVQVLSIVVTAGDAVMVYRPLVVVCNCQNGGECIFDQLQVSLWLHYVIFTLFYTKKKRNVNYSEALIESRVCMVQVDCCNGHS